MTDPFEASDSEQFESHQPDSRLSPLRLVAQHYLLLILGGVVGGVVGTLYYSRATPIYESSTQILVVNKSRNTLSVSDSSGSGTDKESPESELGTQQILIRSPNVISGAIRQGSLAQLTLFGGGDPTGAIINSLRIGQEMSGGKPTSVLNLSFRGTQAEDLPAVLNAVVESYKQFLKKRYANAADETAKLILDANDLLEKKITKKQKEYDRFLTDLPTELWRGKDGFNSVQVQLMTLETRRVDLLNRQADLAGRLQALDKAMKDGRHSRAELLTMMGESKSGGSTGRETTGFLTTDRLLELKLQEKNLLENYGPDHPKVRLVRDQLDLLRGRVKLSDKDSANNDGSGADPVESYVQALRLELEYVAMASVSLGKLLKEAHDKAKPLRSKEIQNESYRTDIARSQALFDAIAKRLDEISILKNPNGGFETEIINPPNVGVKVAPKVTTVLATSVLLGLLAGFGLAYLAEMSDQSFRTPDEIRRRLGLPVVGHIPFIEPEDVEKLASMDGPQISPSLCTWYRPKSRESEAIRGVRTALFFSRQGGHSLIQVTSPDKGDGKSTLSSNLAVSIAQAEKKVILVDADFRRPRVHKLFNASAERGLASVICGEAELNDVIQTTPVPSLSILPCGPIPPNPAELLTMPRFKEVLDLLREKYDYVLVDTPPLLAVTDPCTVVPYVDGVILTIRLAKNARPNASRAKEILTSLRARVIGVVVNGVGSDANSYGYGGYRYGYGGERYGYSYKNYYTYSNYESDAAGSSGKEDEEDMQADGAAEAPKRKQAYASRSSRRKTGFFSWLFQR